MEEQKKKADFEKNMEMRPVNPDDVEYYREAGNADEPQPHLMERHPDDVEADRGLEMERQEGAGGTPGEEKAPREGDAPSSYPGIDQAAKMTPNPTDQPLRPEDEPLDSDVPLLPDPKQERGRR